MVEKANDIVQRVLKKAKEHGDCWPRVLQPAIFECSRREVAHLNYTPFEIHYGYQPLSAIDYRFGQYTLIQARTFLAQPDVLTKLSQEVMSQKVSDSWSEGFRYTPRPSSIRTGGRQLRNQDMIWGVNNHEYAPGDLVFLYDSSSAKKKLHPAFSGPFRISGFGGDHFRSFTLGQVNGEPIKRTFYGDHLRLFKPRTGHLVSPSVKIMVCADAFGVQNKG
jgi:hypothetical protein